MGDYKSDGTNPTFFTSSVRHWLHNRPPLSHGASNACPPFFLNEPSLSPYEQHLHKHKDHHYPHPRPLQNHDQQQQEQYAQSVQPYYPYSHILDDSDKALLATIQLGSGSADRALSSQTINNTTTTEANNQQISMYNIPAILPGMENSHHLSTDWESKQQQHHLQLPHPTIGHRSPFIRHLTPMTELDSVSSSGHSNNGNDDSPHLLNPCVSDNHNHHYQNNHHHNALQNANNSSNNSTVILPNQGTTLLHHPSAMANNHHHHHHHQYGAVDGISAAFLQLTHLYNPLSYSSSTSASPLPFPNSSYSPSNTPFSSSYLPPSPAPSSSLAYPVSYHPNTSGINSAPVTIGCHDESMFLDGPRYGIYAPKWSHSRLLATRSTPAIARRRSQALLDENSFLSESKRTTGPSMVTKLKPLPSSRLSTPNTSSTATAGGARSSSSITSPSSPMNSSGSLPRAMTPSTRPSSSSEYNPLICGICKKEYANNSTLRRHAKIHAYASASSAERKLANPSRTMSSSFAQGSGDTSTVGLYSGGAPTMSTLEAVNTHLLSSFWPYRDNPAPTLPGSLLTTSSTNTSSAAASGGSGGSSSSLIGDAVTTPGQVLQVAATVAAMTMLPGYNPGFDPAIKKPECAGCNKPFARRDTVILHIKNQKRKWDLMCATLPELAALVASDSSTSTDAGAHFRGDADAGGDGSDGEGGGGDDDDADLINHRTSNGAKVNSGKAGTTAAQRRSVRQKKIHPFRVAEKLWQSTLQKKKIHFGPYRKTPPVTATATIAATKRTPSVPGSGSHGRMSRLPSSFGYRGDGDDELDDDMYTHDQYLRQHQHQMDGDMEMMIAYVETDHDENENKGEGGDGWPSEEALESMDNGTKILWMMKMAVVPPCWSVRKVRIFGVQGEVEETVLQDC
ncbi:hypothetical protein F5H01DRAFT_362349 [Linnemannia elongata]|nr:hypothetical protein F5H01DRAFT_362349 [Linnemannia elongata]